MRKTTEELWKQALSEQTVGSDVPETFRRLVIENERECTEPIAIANSTLCGVVFCETTGPLIPCGTKLFAFPPAAIDRDSVIEALQLAHDHMRLYLPHYTEKHNVFDTVTRALKSQLGKEVIAGEVGEVADKLFGVFASSPAIDSAMQRKEGE